jgi:hypothetical protein
MLLGCPEATKPFAGSNCIIGSCGWNESPSSAKVLLFRGSFVAAGPSVAGRTYCLNPVITSTIGSFPGVVGRIVRKLQGPDCTPMAWAIT